MALVGEARVDGLAFAVRRGGGNQPASVLEGAAKCCGSWWKAVPPKRVPPDPVWGGRLRSPPEGAEKKQKEKGPAEWGLFPCGMKR